MQIPFGLNGFDIHEPPIDILLDYTTPKTSEAAFGQATFDITPTLQIVAGARFTHSHFTLNDATTIFVRWLQPGIRNCASCPAGLQGDGKGLAELEAQ